MHKEYILDFVIVFGLLALVIVIAIKKVRDTIIEWKAKIAEFVQKLREIRRIVIIVTIVILVVILIQKL